MDKTLLIVDDDRTARRLIINTLEETAGFKIHEAQNGLEALQILNKRDDIRLVILDLDMPVMDGMETLGAIVKNTPALPVIILTSETDAQSAVNAMKAGAADFLSKPVERARLNVSVRNALKLSMMGQEMARLKRKADDVLVFSDLIGHEHGLADSIKIGRKAAACDLPALITGETGTGKEVFARAIHGESKRAGQNFIALNCGAIPEKLVESTLFGHVKGAFTGAIHKSAGKFQEADSGTIFLDEIGELPLEAQVKLLRVLQQQEVEPVGAAKPVGVNVRILSATNRDLTEEVRKGNFREDLYFRLNVLHIDLPPLRLRQNDIPDLINHFMDLFCALHQTPAKRIPPEAMYKLKNYNWPGNVRELENVINRAMALGDSEELTPDDFSFGRALSEDIRRVSEGLIIPLRPDGSFKSFRELEHEIATLALAHHDGNISKTARKLGIAKSTLYTKLNGPENLKQA